MKPREIINGLSKKGFRVEKRRHVFLILYVDGKKTSIKTMVSHGSDDIRDPLINKMALEVKLEKEQFIELVECPLNEREYVDSLKKSGYIF